MGSLALAADLPPVSAVGPTPVGQAAGMLILFLHSCPGAGGPGHDFLGLRVRLLMDTSAIVSDGDFDGPNR